MSSRQPNPPGRATYGGRIYSTSVTRSPEKAWRVHEPVARARMLELQKLIRTLLIGQPVPYSWAKQNYNAGHDQAIHAVMRLIADALNESPS